MPGNALPAPCLPLSCLAAIPRITVFLLAFPDRNACKSFPTPGADDYVTKPFSIPELLARIRALLRRARGSHSGAFPDELRLADVVVDFRRFEARKGKQTLKLSLKEYGVLRLLAGRMGQVVTRDELLNEIRVLENFLGKLQDTKRRSARIRALRRLSAFP